MAEQEVGRLKVSLSIDSANFEKSISSIDRNLKAMGQEMASARNKGKDWGSSIDGLSTKQEVLTRMLSGQENKVKQLRDAYEKSKIETGENSKATENLAIKLNQAVAQYDKTETELKQVSAALKQQQDELKRSESSWQQLSDKMAAVGSKMKDVGDKMTSVGKDLSLKVTAPIVALGTGAFKAAVDFESAFAGVRKTVDATEEEFQVLSDGIRDMSKAMPVAATEIAGVGEATGQLGIKKESILGFTETMIKLGTATNMSSEEAATALARLANITKMNQNDFDKLGSSIVALGNNFATTESEITEMGLRLAGAGAQVGMSEADILGLSAALTSVGIRAEMGGSAFSRVMVNMQMAASGTEKFKAVTEATGMTLRELQLAAGSGGKAFGEFAKSMGLTRKELNDIISTQSDLENFAKIAGMTAREYQTAFAEDAVGAIGAFVNGLGNAEEAGTSAINMLQEMGITEIQLRDALLRTGGASELFADAVKTSNEGWTENNALNKEAAERYKTTASQMTILWNKVKDLGITIGDILIPKVIVLMDFITPLIEKFQGMSSTVQSVILVIAGIAAAIGPVLVVVGMLISSIGTITTALAPVALAIGEAGGLMAVLGSAMTALTGPIGLIVAAIVGIGAALVLAYNKVEWFRDGVNQIWDKIKEYTSLAFNAVKTLISNLISSTVDFAKGVLDKFKAFWDENGKFITAIVKMYFGQIQSNIELVMGIIKGVFEVVWPLISATVRYAWETIKLAVSTAINLVLGIIQTVLKVLQGDWKGAWDTILQTVKDIWKGVGEFLKGIDLAQTGKDIIQGLINGIGSMASAVWDKVKGIADGIKNAITGVLDIHSPSRVMMQIGKWISEGLGIGIESEKSSLATIMSDIGHLLIDITDHYASEEKKIVTNKNAEISKIEKRSKEDIDKIYRGATAKKRKTTQDENIKIQRIQEDAAKKISEIEKKAANDSYKLLVESDKKMIEEIKLFVQDKKTLDQLSLVEEAKIWEESLKLFGDGTKEKVEAQKNYRNAVEAINKEITSINKQYENEMKQINDDLIKQTNDLNKAYDDAYNNRVASLLSFAGTFDDFKLEIKRTGNDLLMSLQEQVYGIKLWQEEFAKLSSKGIDADLLNEISGLGVKALPELIALNTLTDEQLTMYSALYREKTALAREQAEAELIGMKEDTQTQIEALKDAANGKLITLQKEWTNSIKKLTQSTATELSGLRQIGVDAGQGLLDGLASMEGPLIAMATQIANSIKATIQSALDIHSPSRVMRGFGVNIGQGLVLGMEDKIYAVTEAGKKLATAVTQPMGDFRFGGSSTNSGTNTHTYDYSKQFSPNVTIVTQDNGAKEMERTLRRMAFGF